MRNRRQFLASAAGLAAAAPFALRDALYAATKSAGMKITAVEIWRMTGDPEQYKAYQAKEGHGTTRNLRPMPPNQLYLRIGTNVGAEGFYGTFEQTSSDAVAFIAPMLIGQDPMAIDAIWDRMHAGAHRYSGMYMFGVSTIDHALWDLKGKFLDMPVYKLLGGSRDSIEVYGSAIGFPLGFDEIRTRAAAIRKEGFKSQKWFPVLGVADGEAGFEQNVGIMRTLRETLGEYYDIMIDVLLRWDLQYAIKWCTAVEKYHPRWLEEPVPTPGQSQAIKRLRQVTKVPIATGEHTYGRWEVDELIRENAVDVIQVDPEWGGGISELLKICAVASTHGLQVAPHNQRTIALAHLTASQPMTVCPLMEYQLNIQPNLCYFEKNPLVPKNSVITLPDTPGFDIQLDEAKVVKREKIFSV